MELTDNDRQRIGKEVQRMLEDGVSNVKRGLWDIAMYATRYERQRSSDYALQLLEDLYSETVRENKELKNEIVILKSNDDRSKRGK